VTEFRPPTYPTCPCGGLLSDCRLCGGSGKLPGCLCRGLRYVARLQEGEGQMTWAVSPCPRCGERAVVRQTLPDGLSEEQRMWTFDSLYRELPALTSVATRVEAWALDRAGWYVFAAPWGRGKTYLQCALVNYYQGKGLGAMYWLTGDLLQRLADALYGEDPDWSYGALYRALVQVDLLCLDEFGHEKLTGWREAQLRGILVARSDGSWRPTVFATNREPGHFAEALPWLWSRWADEHTKVEQFEGVPDLRGYLKREVRL